MGNSIIKCINPANMEEIGQVEITPENKITSIVEKAKNSQHSWSSLPIQKRAKYLLRARKYLLENIDSFAQTITLDNGKPLIESLTAEIFPIAELIYYFAHNTKKFLKPKNVPIGIWTLLMRTSKITYQPYGTIGIISPWNYPFSIPVGTAVMALMAGNTVVLKPSSATAMVGQKIAELFNAAGLPEFTFNLISGNSKTGEALLNSKLDKIFFTGSTAIGHHVMNVCSKTLTPCNLELGGKDPMIVLKDADIEHASSAAVWGAFTNAGQCCASVERIYVHKDIAQKFTELVVEKTSKLKVGSGLEPDTDIGPLTTEAQLNIVESQVKDAQKRGAKVLHGGEKITHLNGYFHKPTILTNVDNTFSCVKDETFGPLMPIMTFENTNEAVNKANDTIFGLNAYIWSKNIKLAKSIAARLKTGTVVINDCVYTHALAQTPWGGIKYSGFGRTHGQIGIKEMVNTHHIHTNFCTKFKDIWWYKYNKTLLNKFKKLTRTMTGGLWGKLKSMPTFVLLLLKK